MKPESKYICNVADLTIKSFQNKDILTKLNGKEKKKDNKWKY